MQRASEASFLLGAGRYLDPHPFPSLPSRRFPRDRPDLRFRLLKSEPSNTTSFQDYIQNLSSVGFKQYHVCSRKDRMFKFPRNLSFQKRNHLGIRSLEEHFSPPRENYFRGPGIYTIRRIAEWWLYQVAERDHCAILPNEDCL